MTKRTHKNQHFVAQCYSKSWCDPDVPRGSLMEPYVWMFDRDGTNARRRAPRNVFTETDIYTIEGLDGDRDLRFEHGFQQLEDQFTRIRNLCFNRRLWPSDEQWLSVFTFVATAQARTVAHRDFHREQWREVRQRTEALHDEIERATPERREAMARASGPVPRDRKPGLTLEDVRDLEKYPIQRTIAPVVRSVVPMFMRMHLLVLCTDDPVGFVTTDHPCTWFDPEAYRMPPLFRGPALGSRTIEVTLPISPRQCLVISHNPEFRSYQDVGLRVVDELNRRHIGHCNENFISCRNETRPVWFEHRPIADDAWEAVRERESALGGAA